MLARPHPVFGWHCQPQDGSRFLDRQLTLRDKALKALEHSIEGSIYQVACAIPTILGIAGSHFLCALNGALPVARR